MTHRRAPRRSMTTEDMSLEELVRPISALVLPRAALVQNSGELITEKEARADLLRNSRRDERRKKQKRK